MTDPSPTPLDAWSPPACGLPRIGILVPVWMNYQWIAPIMELSLDRFWPDHPEVLYTGLDKDSPNNPDGIIVELPGSVDRSNWTAVLLLGVREARRRGFEFLYLLAEEHIPVSPCHREHLNQTLPRFMQTLPAVYISLMAWDNRRYTSKSPVLPAAQFHLKHLVAPGDPRFHLHPALWRTEVLEACCQLALEDTSQNGSAWHFEKANDRAGMLHPPGWDKQCYQICASAMSLHPPRGLNRLTAKLEYFLYQRLQGLYPLIPGRMLRKAYAAVLEFDKVFCNGAYPMFFSGIMSKGQLNEHFTDFMRRHDPEWLEEILNRRPPEIT
ncbi:MAG: hypothetical protein Fur0032_01910 [Terrimicrobiaceae bacterium]